MEKRARGVVVEGPYNQSLAHKATGVIVFSVRPKARNGKLIETGNEEI